MAVEERKEFPGSDDEEVLDERKHNQLLDAMSALDGKKKNKLSQRTVITNQISEFNFASSKDTESRVHLNELLGSLKDTASHGDLKKQLRTVRNKTKIVSAPLPKHEKAKIERTTAYQSTTQEVSKWDPIVNKNRKAEQLQFPLQKQDFRIITTDQLIKRFQPRTPLEMQIAAMLQGSDNVIHNPDQELTLAEQRALKAMDLKEAKERRLELMQHRALLSYKEAKAKRQKKIKSKSYHRLLKKERLKNERKALEKMQHEDPEGYLEKLELLEKDRVQERMSLKHRGGSKFAQRQMIYAKFDDRARQEVQDMLQKSRKLTEKIKVESDSEDELPLQGVIGDARNATTGDIAYSSLGSNPWMAKLQKNLRIDSVFSKPVEILNKDMQEENDDIEKGGDISDKEINVQGNDKVSISISTSDSNDHNNASFELADQSQDVINDIFDKSSSAKKLKDKKMNKISAKNSVSSKKVSYIQKSDLVKPNKRKTNKKKNTEENTGKLFEENNDISNSELLIRKRTLDDLDDLTDEEIEPMGIFKKVKIDTGNTLECNVASRKVDKKEEAYVDPKRLLTIETKIKKVGLTPQITGHDDDDGDDDVNEQQRMTIAQAFADDDVLEEFLQEKNEKIESGKPKDIDLVLPGWGQWGGTGITVPQRKRRRFIIKATPPLPRRDQHLGHVILNESKISTVAKHQVSKLPFPYRNVEQFHKSIRAPLGKTWNPEIVYKALIKPKIVSHLGKIITPMDKSEVFAKKQKHMWPDTDA